MSQEFLNEKIDSAGTIECSKVLLNTLTLKENVWRAKLILGAALPKSYHRYTVTLEFNLEPYEIRIKEIEDQLNDSLFGEDEKEKDAANDRIAEIRDKMNSLFAESEVITFSGVVEEIKWKSFETHLTIIVPDDVIEQLNKQKYRLQSYKAILEPVTSHEE